MAVRLFVQLTVKNFDAWKEMFDGAAQFMKEMGVTANEYLAMLEGAQARRADEGILTWELWVGNSV
jgi:hypothetical protein